jgi:hypothetical protein
MKELNKLFNGTFKMLYDISKVSKLGTKEIKLDITDFDLKQIIWLYDKYEIKKKYKWNLFIESVKNYCILTNNNPLRSAINLINEIKDK